LHESKLLVEGFSLCGLEKQTGGSVNNGSGLARIGLGLFGDHLSISRETRQLIRMREEVECGTSPRWPDSRYHEFY
jgi:hypothetical protein